MKIQYDKKVDAVYIRFQNGQKRVAKTFKLKDFFLVDMAKRGEILGIEILDASLHIPVRRLPRIDKPKTKK